MTTTQSVAPLSAEELAELRQVFTTRSKATEYDEQIFRGIDRLLVTLTAKEEIIAGLQRLVHVPGQWRCAKCKYVGMHMTICASSGNVGVKADAKTEICPNGCGPLWPVTERQAGNELIDRMDIVVDERNAETKRADENFDDFTAAKSRAETAEARVKVLEEALRWALPLACSAVEQHRFERTQHGHNDIRAIRTDGTVLVGLWQNEYDDMERAKASLSPPTQVTEKEAT